MTPSWTCPERGAGGVPLGIRSIALPDLDDPGVLGVPVGEDGLEDRSGVGEM